MKADKIQMQIDGEWHDITDAVNLDSVIFGHRHEWTPGRVAYCDTHDQRVCLTCDHREWVKR